MSKDQVLAGRFRLTEKLGQGGMGSVWRAEDLSLGTAVAVKLIDPSIADNAEAVARFKREAQAAAALRSAHVVQILDCGVDGGTPYIAMELLVGESLADRLRRVGRLSPLELGLVFSGVAKALARAHEFGIVHRDLKPDNVFLVREGEDQIAKVLDFGIAKKLDSISQAGFATRTGAMMGTPYYMSPEQASGKRTVDHRTDIWALGVIAVECLVGKRPFDADTIGGLVVAICMDPMPVPSQMGAVPAGFDAWFARVCARDIAARCPTATDAIAELRRLCGAVSERPSLVAAPLLTVAMAATADQNLGATAAPSSVTLRKLGIRRRRTSLWVAAGLCVFGFVAGTLGWFASRSDRGVGAAGPSTTVDQALLAPATTRTSELAAIPAAPEPSAIAARPEPAINPTSTVITLVPNEASARPSHPPKAAEANRRVEPVRPLPARRAPAAVASAAPTPTKQPQASREERLGF
jgi:eukaryotic-like serine/threonine-protein kinase